MRLNIKIKLDKSLTLPKNHHQILQAAIYNISRKGNPEYTKWLHDEGDHYGKRTYKMFTFSLLNGSKTEEVGMYTYKGTIKFSIASIRSDWIKELQRVLKKEGITFGEKTFKDVETSLEDVYTLQSEIVVKTLSPIIAHRTDRYRKNMQFFGPYEDEFSELINDNAKRKYKVICGEEIKTDLYIVPLEGEEVEEYDTKYKQTPMIGWLGKYKIIGNPKVLTLLLNVGIGSKNAQGFGMIEER